MSASHYYAAKILDHSLGGPAFAPPDPVYLALYSADPGAAGDATANEITGVNYTRVALGYNDTVWPAAGVDGGYVIKANGEAIEFSIAGAGGWGAIRAAALVDTASGAGNVLLRALVNPPGGIDIAVGDTFRFEPGDLRFRIPTSLS